jgi:hypothetical protein
VLEQGRYPHVDDAADNAGVDEEHHPALLYRDRLYAVPDRVALSGGTAGTHKGGSRCGLSRSQGMAQCPTPTVEGTIP